MTEITTQEIVEATREDMARLLALATDDEPEPGEFTTEFYQNANNIPEAEIAWHTLKKLMRRGYVVKSRRVGKYTFWKFTEKYAQEKIDSNKTGEGVV